MSSSSESASSTRKRHHCEENDSRNKIEELEVELASIKQRLSALENNIQVSNNSMANNETVTSPDNMPNSLVHYIIPLSDILQRQASGIEHHRQIALIPPHQRHNVHGTQNLNITYIYESDSEDDDSEFGDGEFDEEARELFLHLQHLIRYHGARII
ncbi:hypothetical protein PVAND_002413 [Polypedilum vanderplanki]|uniref:Uncharacterized protein n=1 Tax=Polypedilum vanderplanki TaxID=319348 RepID=A0A9J6BRA1_POLVA|nr:hypothetical protein PVAND_002413 [Polypedilum vanderplanki]